MVHAWLCPCMGLLVGLLPKLITCRISGLHCFDAWQLAATVWSACGLRCVLHRNSCLLANSALLLSTCPAELPGGFDNVFLMLYGAAASAGEVSLLRGSSYQFCCGAAAHSHGNSAAQLSRKLFRLYPPHRAAHAHSQACC